MENTGAQKLSELANEFEARNIAGLKIDRQGLNFVITHAQSAKAHFREVEGRPERVHLYLVTWSGHTLPREHKAGPGELSDRESIRQQVDATLEALREHGRSAG